MEILNLKKTITEMKINYRGSTATVNWWKRKTMNLKTWKEFLSFQGSSKGRTEEQKRYDMYRKQKMTI